MNYIMKEILEEYQKYLEDLVQQDSNEIFTNAGLRHASILMSTLVKNTKSSVKMYATGLNPRLITSEPYYTEFCQLFSNLGERKIEIMVETRDFVHEQPFQLVFAAQHQPSTAIEIKLIHNDDKAKINKELNLDQCNFSIFDAKMFRLEYDPSAYKAFGSFNHIDWSKKLTDLFDEAFMHGDLITSSN